MAQKNVYADKWSTEVLEQIAVSCNIAAQVPNRSDAASAESDWRLFLSAVYDGIRLLNDRQRIVLLLSQEVGLSLTDIARILNISISCVLANLRVAVDKLVFYLKSRSLVKKNMFTCKAMELIYKESLDLEECNHEAVSFEFLDKYAPPFFCSKNYLVELVYGGS